MRKRTMRAAIDAMNSGEPLPAKLEAETDRDARYAEDLHRELQGFLLAWHAKHPDAEDAIEPVLARALAVRLMAQGMGPDDVADFVREASLYFAKEALEIRRRAQALGRS